MLPVVEAERALLRMESGGDAVEGGGSQAGAAVAGGLGDVGGDVSGEGGEGDGVGWWRVWLPLPAKVLERDSFPPLPPLARAVRVMLEVVVEMVMGRDGGVASAVAAGGGAGGGIAAAAAAGGGEG